MKLTEVEDQIYVMDSSVNTTKALQMIAESSEEAFYVLDIEKLIQKHQEWLNKLPLVKPHYAVKCNDNIPVLRTLAALGLCFDCASPVELEKVMSLGVGPDRIVFANPTKPVSHIRLAASIGVDLMTFDNETELYKIKELYPKARLLLRIRCDAEHAITLLGEKYGCDSILEAPHLLRLARFLGLQVVGVSFHVGTGCQDPPIFRKAISLARNLFDSGSKLDFNMYILDLGGGFPGASDSLMDRIADVINAALKRYFPPDTDTHIIAEPGRYYVESVFTLATNIHSKKDIFSRDKQLLHTKYYIDCGVYSAFLTSVHFEHCVPTAVPLMAPKSDDVYSCSLWGPSCDSLDRVTDNAFLPRMNLGDWLVFPNMGAYTSCLACAFNGFPLPKVYAVITEKDWQLLKDALSFTDNQLKVHQLSATSDEIRAQNFSS